MYREVLASSRLNPPGRATRFSDATGGTAKGSSGSGGCAGKAAAVIASRTATREPVRFQARCPGFVIEVAFDEICAGSAVVSRNASVIRAVPLASGQALSDWADHLSMAD